MRRKKWFLAIIFLSGVVFTAGQQERITRGLIRRRVPKGTLLHSADQGCTGLLLVESGRLRAYLLSDEGRQITVYRLFGRDLSPDPSNPSPNFMGQFYHNPRDPPVTMSPFDSVRFLSRF